jgi:serine/threonine protein kinase
MEDSGRRQGGRAPFDPDPGSNAPAHGAPVTPGALRTPVGGYGGGYPGAPLTPGGFTPRPPLLPDDSNLLPGTMLGKYQIVARLGSGGMGSVYEAVHTDIAKPVALKTLSSRLASEPRAQARFLREAAAASRLNHPHVVDVTDYGADGGVTYIVMELLRGEDLGGMVARSPSGMPVEATADVMLAVCAGVFAAHEVGVIHRDLKPQNIFLAHTAIGDVVPKVLDFGISKLLDEQLSSNLTGTGTVMGTTPYLSPEQVAGHPIDARSDQYTLGVILYECVTGRRPHDGDSLFAIMRSIADGNFVRPRQLRPDLPSVFEALILRTMGHPPDRRFESVHALGQALLPFASPKAQVIWSDYFTTERGARHTAPLPSHPSPEPFGTPGPRGHAYTPGGRPLPSTHTGNRHPATPTIPPRFGAGYEVRPRRWPAFLAVFAVFTFLAGAALWAYRGHLPAWISGRPDEPVEPAPAEPAPPPPTTDDRPAVPVTAPGRPGAHAVSPAPVRPRPIPDPAPPATDDPVWPQKPGIPAPGDPARPAEAAAPHPVKIPSLRPIRPFRPHLPHGVRPLGPAPDPEAPILD